METSSLSTEKTLYLHTQVDPRAVVYSGHSEGPCAGNIVLEIIDENTFFRSTVQLVHRASKERVVRLHFADFVRQYDRREHIKK